MSCKYNNCKICDYKLECEIYKENAKLQNDKNTLIAQIIELKKIKIITVCNQDYVDLENKLTKAKGIINTFVDWKKGEGGYDLPKDFLYYAEQFINEVEK